MHHLPRAAAAAALLAALASVASPALANPASPTAVESARSDYIVVLQPGTDARGVARAITAAPKHTYSAALDGFSARLTAAQVRVLQRNPAVVSVERDQQAVISPDVAAAGRNATVAARPSTPTSTTQSLPRDNSQWNLDRIDQSALPLNRAFSYTSTGKGVTAYVLDTGVDTAHPDFGGRAITAYDAVEDGTVGDCNGHGTHVAGTLAGARYGVAKNASIAAVRVLGCDGTGSYSNIIAGLDWIAANRTGPSVANISLGGGRSDALNAAVDNLVSSGVFVAVAAGNDSVDACTASPASAASATTVGATTVTDGWASFSNYGTCVDVLAPGDQIASDWPGSRVATLSGTSMASPAVAGAAALYVAANPSAAPASVSSWLAASASSGRISAVPAATPNKLLNKVAL